MVKVHYGEGVATHTGPKSCAVPLKGHPYYTNRHSLQKLYTSLPE